MSHTKRLRWYRVGGALVVVCATIAVAQPDSLAHAGLDFWNLPTLNEQIDEGTAAGEAIEMASAATRRRIETKDEIVRDLIEGDIDLLKAASHFRNLNSCYGDYLAVLHTQYPGRTDEECICRNVIAYTKVLIAERPDRAEILKRLEAEYARFRQSQIHIPA